MKRVFISHPFRNNPDANLKEILEIGRKLAALNIAYFSPITNYCALDDADGAQREFGLKCCEEWIPYCDELWLFGDWEKSEGCQREHLTALLELIPVYIVTGWDESGFPIFKDGIEPEWIMLATPKQVLAPELQKLENKNQSLEDRVEELIKAQGRQAYENHRHNP